MVCVPVYQLAPMFRKTQVLKSGMDLEYLKQVILVLSVISSNINLQLLVTEAICCCTQEWYFGWEKVSCVERCPCFRG